MVRNAKITPKLFIHFLPLFLYRPLPPSFGATAQPEPLNPLFRKDETNSNHSPKSPSVSPVTCSASPVTSKVTDESP